MHQMTDGGLFLTVVYKVLPFLQPPKPLRSFISQREGICCFLLIHVFDIWVHRIHIGTTSGHEQHVQSINRRTTRHGFKLKKRNMFNLCSFQSM